MTLSVLGRADSASVLQLPFYVSQVSAGFPSPASDYIESTLDLNELCIQHPAATYFVRVQGDSMVDAGIEEGDVLVVDRSLQATQDDIVIAGWNGELTCKRLQLKPFPQLLACNPAYAPLTVPEGEMLDVFGVVVSVVRNLRRH